MKQLTKWMVGILYIITVLGLTVSVSYGQEDATPISKHWQVDKFKPQLPLLEIGNLAKRNGDLTFDLNHGEGGFGFTFGYREDREKPKPFDTDIGLFAFLGQQEGESLQFSLGILISTLKIKDADFGVGAKYRLSGGGSSNDRTSLLLSMGF